MKNRIVLIVVLSLLPRIGMAQDGRGPFELRNQFPLHRHHLSLSPDKAEGVKEREYSISSAFVTSNTSLKYDSYTVDSESREGNLSFNYGVTNSFEIGASTGLLWQGGGVLDDVIDSWHKWFGLPRGRRDRLPTDDFHVTGDTTRETFEFEDKGIDLGVSIVSAKYLLHKETGIEPTVGLKFETLLPFSTVREAPDKPDAGLSLLLSKNYSPFFLYGGASYIRFFDEETDNLNYKSGHVEAFFSLEYEWNRDLSLITALTLISEPTKNLAAGPSHTSYLDVGFKYQLDDNLELSLAVRENPGPRKLSTDISALLGVSYRLRPEPSSRTEPPLAPQT